MGNEQTKPNIMNQAISSEKSNYAADANTSNNNQSNPFKRANTNNNNQGNPFKTANTNNNNKGNLLKTAEEWFNDGVEHTFRDTNKALEAFNRAIGQNQKYADAYALKANVLRMHKKFQEALEVLNQAISIDSQCTLAYYNKAKVLVMQDNTKEAENCFERGTQTQQNKNSFLIALDIGAALFFLGKNQDAINWCDHAIQLNPHYPISYCFKGYSLYKLGKHQDAINCYDTAGQLGLGGIASALAYLNKGYSLSALGRHQESINCYDKCLQVRPDEYAYEAHLNKGCSLYSLARHQECISSCNKALQLKPDCPKALRYKGYALFYLWKFRDAIHCFKKSLKIDREGEGVYWAYSTMAYCYYYLGQHHDAIQWFDEAISMNPSLARTYNAKALPLEKLGRYNEAAQAKKQAETLKSVLGDGAGVVSAEEWFLRANVHKKLNNHAGAIEAYNNAINIKPAYANEIPAEYREVLLRKLKTLQQTTNNTKAMMTAQLRENDSQEARNLAERFKKLQEEQTAIADKVQNLIEKNDAREVTPDVEQEMMRVNKQMLALQQQMSNIEEQQDHHSKQHEQHTIRLDQHEQKLSDLATQTKLLIDLSAKGQATVDMIKSTLFTNIKLQGEHKQEVDAKLSIITSEVAKGKAKSDLVQHMLKDINEIVKEHGILLDQFEQKQFDLETQTQLLIDLIAKGQATVDLIKSTLFTNIKLQAEHKQEVDAKLSIITSEVAKGKAKSDLVQHMLKDINEIVKEHGTRLAVESHDEQQH